MVTSFYFITFIASAVLTGIIVFKNKKVNTLYVLMGLCLTVNTLGRYLLSVSHTTELAVWSTKILYFGGCFMVPVILAVVVQLYGFTLNKLVQAFLYGFATTNYAFVLTIGYSDIYYKSYELAYKDGYYYLVKEYGPAHALFLILMLMCFSVLVFYIFYAIRNRNVLSTMIVVTMSVLTVGTIACYIVEKILSTSVEYVTVGFLGIAIAASILFRRMNMYDMTINIANYVERENSYGYIVFDKKIRYMNSNENARELFPEIRDWCVDSVVKKDDSAAYREIVENIEEKYLKKTRKRINIGEKFYEISVREIVADDDTRNKIIGYMVELTDETADQMLINTIQSYNTKLEQEVNERTSDILRIKDMMVLGMAAMVESRDNSTGGHIRRTSDVVKVFSRRLLNSGRHDMTYSFLEMVSKAAPMHDLGKIAVDDAVLRKNGRFTDEEYAKMKHHSAEGAQIVHNILSGVESEEFVSIATNVAYYHHEKWNGYGYPNNLKGEEIPVEARIMALADVFDALVSKRCYKEAFTYEKAFEIIKNDLGTHFDPELGKIFLECRPELEALYNSY